MTLDTIVKLKSNPNYLNYIHENCHWYKILTRNPEMFNQFIKEMKYHEKIKKTDRLSKALDALTVFENILSTLK